MASICSMIEDITVIDHPLEKNKKINKNEYNLNFFISKDKQLELGTLHTDNRSGLIHHP